MRINLMISHIIFLIDYHKTENKKLLGRFAFFRIFRVRYLKKKS